MNDWQLLNQFAANGSDEAFRLIVERYGGLVYHTALRQVGNTHLAEEATQAVFIALAQKAGKIPRNVVLSGWLFRATRFAVRNLVREEARRQRREQEAVMMESSLRTEVTESVWAQISPHLNDALAKLSDRDREVVLIRFFEEKSHREVASALGISEDAAKMRVSRGIEKLRSLFLKRGLATPSAVLVAVLSTHGAQAAPAGLSAFVATAAVAKGTATTSTVTLAKGILKFMAWSKTKMALAAGTALLFTGGVILQQIQSKAPPASVAVQADRSTPKGCLLAISQAIDAGDAKQFLDSFVFVSQDDDATRDTLRRLITAIGEFRRLSIERFGPEAAMASFSSLPFKMPVEKIQAATETIHGDTAEVLFDARDRPIVLTRQGGQWKTTPVGLFHMDAEALTREGTAFIAVFERMSAGIRAGNYQSAMEAANAAHGKRK